MLIHNPVFSGSISLNGTDISKVSTVSTDSASFAARLTSNEARTGSFATTGSNQFNGSQTVTGSLTVTGNINAQTLVIQTITSSVAEITGSTQFGTTTGNTHEFTGSVLVRGNVSFGSSSISEGVQGASSLSFIPSSSVSGGPLIQFASNGRIRPASTGDRLSIEGNALYLNTVFNNSIIMGSGNVGIGTASPTKPLYIVGNNSFQGTQLAISASGDSAGIQLLPSPGGVIYEMQATTGGQYIIYDRTNSAYRMVIASGSGNVGIGTSSPAYTLDVSTNQSTYVARFYQPSATTTNYNAVIWSGAHTPVVGYVVIGGATAGNTSLRDTFAIGTQNAYGFALVTNDVGRMYITSGGNVGIGASSPGVKFVNAGATLASSPTLGSGTIGANAILSANGLYGLYTGVASEGWVWQQVQRNDTNSSVYSLVLQPSGGSVLVGTTTKSYSESLIVKGSSSSMGVIRFENAVNQADVNHGTLMIVNTANYAVGNDASIGFALQNASNSFTDPRASIGCKTSSNLGGDLVFNTRNDAGYTEKMRITKDGQVTLSNSTGIRFANGSSNLNYYEEGSWTPILSGTGGGAYNAASGNSGRYVRIGNQVTVEGTLVWSGGGAYAGNLIIAGLPFASSGVRSAGSMGAVASGINYTAGYGMWVLVNDPTTSYIYIIQLNTSGAGYSHTPTVASSGTIYGFTLTYFIV